MLLCEGFPSRKLSNVHNVISRDCLMKTVRYVDMMDFWCISYIEIKDILGSLSKSKAVGCDEVSSEAYRYAPASPKVVLSISEHAYFLH